MIAFRVTFILCFSVLLAGCAGVQPRSSIAHITRNPQGRYEIKLGSVEWVAGGPCNFPQMPHRSFGVYWIYTDSTNGFVTADRVTLASGSDWDTFRATYDKEPLHGSLLFTNGTVRVSLLRPAYPDGVHLKYYRKFDLNGTYKLQEE